MPTRILAIYDSAEMDLFEADTFWIDDGISDDKARALAVQLPEFKQHEEAACCIVNSPIVGMDGQKYASAEQFIAMYSAEFMGFRTAVTYWITNRLVSKFDLQLLRQVDLPAHMTFKAIHDPAFFVMRVPTKTIAPVIEEPHNPKDWSGIH